MAHDYHAQSKQIRHALVMGLGRFGGGLGVTRYLLDQGWRVTLNDQAEESDLREPLDRLGQHPHQSLALGGHDPALLKGVDLLVVNPAVSVPWSNPFIQAADQAKIEITTEIEIAFRLLNPPQIIAITGSAGKSTTSAMTHAALVHAGFNAHLGGNIGGSLLERIDSVGPSDPVVLELSSAMLYWLWGEHRDQPPHAPAVACVTSYSPNHIDWHGSESHYKQSKQRLPKILTGDSTLVLPKQLAGWAPESAAHITICAETDAIPGCSVMGAHNASNAALALACANALRSTADQSRLLEGITRFPGLPHRLHRCHEDAGVVYIDDSKSTTPQATTLAVDAICTRVEPCRIHLIAGGYDKGADLQPIAEMAPKLAGLYAIGATAQALCAQSSSGAILCGTLQAAMQRVSERLTPGEFVLLSPGCASWDQFTNYEERGKRFYELARTRRQESAC